MAEVSANENIEANLRLLTDDVISAAACLYGVVVYNKEFVSIFVDRAVDELVDASCGRVNNYHQHQLLRLSLTNALLDASKVSYGFSAVVTFIGSIVGMNILRGNSEMVYFYGCMAPIAFGTCPLVKGFLSN